MAAVVLAAAGVPCSNRTMDVRGVAASAGGLDPSAALRGASLPAHSAPVASAFTLPGASDTVASLLQELSESNLTALLNVIERPPTAAAAAQVEALMQAAVTAAANGNVVQALQHLAAMAPLDPRRAEALPGEPALSAIRGDVERLLNHLASGARSDAEGRLTEAVKLLETALARDMMAELDPELRIRLAGRFIEAGGYVNFLRSAELSQTILDFGRWAPATVPLPPDEPVAGVEGVLRSSSFVRLSFALQRQVRKRVRRLWQRAPLLVLLLAWLIAGLVGAALLAIVRSVTPEPVSASLVSYGYEIWGLGFIAIVLFGFYTRVRTIRF